jgi:glycosyltransferase involved in cell wall biosynthesis
LSSPVPPVSVVVLAKDERRCIARCLDSVAGKGFDRVVVLDTGSADGTIGLVREYRKVGVELHSMSWTGSFADARNHGIDVVGTGWIVFLDADEWFAPDAAERLIARLRELAVAPAPPGSAFAPVILDVDRGSWVDQVPRVFLVESGIRYRGPVHEYPVVAGDRDTPIELSRVDVEIRHDGYTPEVVYGKRKTERNLALLDLARAGDPDDPRWLYFTVHDGLPFLPAARLIRFCEKLEELAARRIRTGDHLPPVHYLRLALPLACQGLGFRGDWDTVDRYCARIDELDGGGSPDAQYLRAMAEVADGVVTTRTLKETIAVRRADESLLKSTLCRSGRHLDAAIAALLECRGGADDAERYRAICDRWDDMFFEDSKLRAPQAVLL